MLEIFKNTEFGNLIEDVNSGVNVTTLGLNSGEKGFLCKYLKKPLIFVAPNISSSQNIQKQLESLAIPTKSINFINKDCTYAKYSQNEVEDIFKEALMQFYDKTIECLIITPEVLLTRLPSKNLLNEKIIRLKKNCEFGLENLKSMLIKSGYKRQSEVDDKGKFSVRGDIVDVFPENSVLPYRISFFDDTIEQIKSYNTQTYMTIDEVEEISIMPCSLIFPDTQDINEIKQKINLEKSKAKLSPDDMVRLNNLTEKVLTEIEKGEIDSNFFVPYFKNYDQNILSYIDEGTVIFDDLKQINDSIRKIKKEFDESYTQFNKAGELLSSHKNFLISENDVFTCNANKLAFINLSNNNNAFKTQKIYSFECNPCVNYNGNFDLLTDDLEFYLEKKYQCLVFAENATTAVNLQQKLQDKLLPIKLISKLENAEKKFVNIYAKPLNKGICLAKDKIFIVSSQELIKGKTVTQVKKTNKNLVFTMPKVGDYIVHDIHGVGICDGFERLKVGEYERDYIVLRYKNNDKYYLPTEKIQEISSYVANGVEPKLNRLGGDEFIKDKEKVKGEIKKMAFDLINLYAERQFLKGFRYEIDELLYKDFCAGFEYEETFDQLQAIYDIEKDMLSDKIMDRLVCGDVGYGKTEVAMRAMFIAIMNGKQVAFLCPTTVLSQQHFSTLQTRMQEYMVNIEVLNRFKTPKQQAKILEDVKNGKINILCGTHRLLSKDVEFKNLGLLVLDEEQKFGVEDKEKLKNIKKNIDVLTLSATPIPRTLHFSMSGIRDISIIETPPKNRLPVQTIVNEFSEILLKEAVNRELKRQGQVLIIYNRVESILNVFTYISKMFPNVNVDYAHGQMNEKQLFTAIKNLYERNTDILISTTLIENGVDLPTANTIFVMNADYLGLSELYQLKGRVGRSDKLAYAYFTYEKNKVLTEDAYKRLGAITEFSGLGSGFKIAMKDLEIRGAGNILGKQQHGQIAKVGYDMYCKLLNEATKEIKGEKITKKQDVKITVDLSAFIPKNYVSDNEDRFRLYNDIASIETIDERTSICNRIIDIYKVLPSEVENLTKIALIQNMASKLGITKVIITKKECSLVFESSQDALSSKIGFAIKSVEVSIVYNFKDLPIINFECYDHIMPRKVDLVIKFLNFALKFGE